MCKKVISIVIVLIVFATGCSNNKQPKINVSTVQTVNVITLDKLYTYGKIDDYNKPDDITYSYTKDVNSKEVSITEQEYLALIQKYCSAGVLDATDSLKANEIVINSWEPLTAYK